MRSFGREFWPRLFWYVVALHFVLLWLYVTAPRTIYV